MHQSARDDANERMSPAAGVNPEAARREAGETFGGYGRRSDDDGSERSVAQEPDLLASPCCDPRDSSLKLGGRVFARRANENCSVKLVRQ